MKNKILVLLLMVFLLFGSIGCHTSTQSSQKKHNAAITKVENTGKAMERKINSIEEKGKAYVYGAQLSLDKTPRDIHPGVDITDRLVDYAALTLGPPSLEDAKKMQEIVDGLFKELRLKEEEVKEAESKTKAAELRAKETELKAKAEVLETKTEKLDILEQAKVAKEQAKVYEEQAKLAHKDVEKTKKEIADAEAKLQTYTGKVIILENQLDYLKTNHESALTSANKVAQQNADKAAKWEEENTFLNSINPFHDLGKFFKKLFIWAAIIVVAVITFKILGIIWPAFGVVDGVFGWFGKMVFKLMPAAKKTAGVVSVGVWKGLKHTVVAIDHALDKLRNHPIEEEVIKAFPEDAVFNKPQVRGILKQHTENVVKVIISELNEHQDSESKGIVHKAKVDSGLKQDASSHNDI